MYAIDLFCGAGGFSEGILQAGFHIVFSSDKSPYVQQTYENRHKQLGLVQGYNTFFKLADIRELQGSEILESINSLTYFKEKNKTFGSEDIDVIFGGPPCQGFSIAGKRDKSDPRNMLFREYLRVIKDLRPKYIVMENVTGFMSMQINPDFKSFNGINYADNELVKNVVKKELEAFDYIVLEPQILDASDFGVPQKRQRAIFLAYRKGLAPLNYPAPEENLKRLTVKDALAGLSLHCDSGFSKASKKGRTPYFKTNNTISNDTFFNVENSNHSAAIKERFSLFKQGESIVNIKDRITKKLLNHEKLLDLNEYPNLKLETLFNINKNSNLKTLREFVLLKNLHLTDSQINSFYKRIIKIWNFDIESSEYKKEIRKPFSKFKIDSDIQHSIFISCKNKFNSYISEETLILLFNGKITHSFDVDNNPILLIKGKEEVILLDDLLNALLTNKNTRTRLSLEKSAPTMITLPDDFIHPELDRILNVREMARIQSFDDSFEFLGKRTTGGNKRVQEVPQFTQVGNAVPPLMAYAIAKEVMNSLKA
ncbi:MULTISPECIES: DNA (cytosine-5-)-methyltransferase [Bacillus cereus group]|nr:MULTISPECIES: DNA cytosine methyltransferase [Bacillus cereus group]MEB9862139.1 DNA cytosine methyltransferase [Bacillus cereus]PFD34999.1 DNA (cytosine-5-)-methyltransferase [Bacillus thuringiensis]PFN79004.1 DNA (cytosine-5-)-methyltransferase [Bacillus cereus]PFU74479.1 DNA (cytosine-5-)-methyltransferase [Bacillus cereus]